MGLASYTLNRHCAGFARAADGAGGVVGQRASDAAAFHGGMARGDEDARPRARWRSRFVNVGGGLLCPFKVFMGMLLPRTQGD
jgi:hypothetical protein